MILQVTHLSPGTGNHLQAVLENLHYNHKVVIESIYEKDEERWVEYEIERCVDKNL